MYIVIEVGRRAGEVVDLPYHIASGMLEAGTARHASDEDFTKAKIEPPVIEAPKLDVLPEGYTTAFDREYGINLFAPGDNDQENALEGSPFRNMVEVRQAAHLHLETMSEKPKGQKGRPVGGSKEAAAQAAMSLAPPPPPGE